MNKEHTDKLVADFPNLFAHKCDCSLTRYGFECGDGWFDIIYELAKDVEELAKKTELSGLVVRQVKEKFGGLRFYLNKRVGRDIQMRIDKAELIALATCEECAHPGYRRNLGYIKTLCDCCARQSGVEILTDLVSKGADEPCRLCGSDNAEYRSEGAFPWCWVWPTCDQCKPAPLHDNCFILTEMGDEAPYVLAFCYGRNMPVFESQNAKGQRAVHASDYAEWRRWRLKAGHDWKEKSKTEWWFEFIHFD